MKAKEVDLLKSSLNNQNQDGDTVLHLCFKNKDRQLGRLLFEKIVQTCGELIDMSLVNNKGLTFNDLEKSARADEFREQVEKQRH